MCATHSAWIQNVDHRAESGASPGNAKEIA
jgi:hypothetical protein